jgi:hypothetical protein
MTTIRRAGTASVATLSGLVLTLGLMQTAAPEWARFAGLDVWNVSAAQESCRAADQRRGALETQAEQLHDEIQFIEQVASRLAAGTISMAAATDSVEPILRERSAFNTVAEIYYPAPTFRLTVARYLSARVLQHSSLFELVRWATLATRLEVEYAAMK